MAEFYRGKDWMGELPAEIQQAILARMVPRSLKEGERLYERGAAARELYLVVNGFVQLKSTGPDGNEMLVTIYGPDCWLGDIALASNSKRTYDAVAVGNAQVLALPREDFRQLMAQHPEIYQAFFFKLSGTIDSLLSHIQDSALLTLRQRLAKLLLSAVKAYGHPDESCDRDNDSIVVDMPLSQEDMGKLLGVTRHSIMRELKQWQAAGMIRKQNNRWVVIAPSTLKQYQQG